MTERFNGRVAIVDDQNREVFTFDPRFAVLDLGSEGNEGDLRLRGDDGAFTFHLDGGRQMLFVRDAAGRTVLEFVGANSLLRVGAQGNEGDIQILDSEGEVSIHLDGGSGDIVLTNADCAEDFDCLEDPLPSPGSVVVIGDEGAVATSDRAYDTRVAGVVSGAGMYRPAIVLGRRADSPVRRLPVALTGRVACLVDATMGPVRVGDLLTTAPLPGHAMRARDRFQATGCIVGKALGALPEGTGLVPMLVCLR